MTTSAFEPGIYSDVPEDAYHSRAFGPADSLSSTEANRLLRAPAVFRCWRDNPQPARGTFDLGHVVHRLVLGQGMGVYVHDHEALRTKAAREDVAQAREEGLVPVSRGEFERMSAVADAVLTHPVAGPLFEAGEPEQSVYAVDKRTDVWMRGRVDWATDDGTLLVDLKTTRDANPTSFYRAVTAYGYDLQCEWYRTIWQAITGTLPRFQHVLVEKEAPFLVAVIELGDDFEEIGRLRVRRALDTYRRCLDEGVWPGYPPIIHPVDAPSWYVSENGLDDIQMAVA